MSPCTWRWISGPGLIVITCPDQNVPIWGTTPPPGQDCDCQDKMVQLTIVYQGTNGSNVTVVTGGGDNVGNFTNVQVGDTLVLFDGRDPMAVEHARGQWRSLTRAGCAAQYWSQESGAWEKKAES